MLRVSVRRALVAALEIALSAVLFLDLLFFPVIALAAAVPALRLTLVMAAVAAAVSTAPPILAALLGLHANLSPP